MSDIAITQARAHALECYPEESVGFVVNGQYWPLKNIHETPETHFRVDTADWLRATKAGGVELFLHSHPNGPMFPSENDMIAQVTTNVPWGIIVTNGQTSTYPKIWGGPISPLIGREFVHGVTDCYSMVRDVYRTGRQKLIEDDITFDWPYDPIDLPEVPRPDGWWDKEGYDLYACFEKYGFYTISKDEARPGDGFLGKIRSDKLNHAGVLLTNDLIAHHLPNRVSRREPAGIWGRMADVWIRFDHQAYLEKKNAS